MAAEEAVAALGEPLLRTSGKGLELWIYDNQAEVLLYGPVIGWTTPGSRQVPGRAVDIWQRQPGEVDAPVFLLPRPSISRKDAAAGKDSPSEESNPLPYLRLRK
jgi:hypothetical protein